jgi:hypothetical protein
MFSEAKHIVNVFDIDTSIDAFYFSSAKDRPRVYGLSGASGASSLSGPGRPQVTFLHQPFTPNEHLTEKVMARMRALKADT